MVLERAGGWRSLADFVETKGYSLDTLQTLYTDKLKPSFKSIFPSRSTEVDQPLAAEMVAADADTKRCPVPAFMIKDYVIPLTGIHIVFTVYSQCIHSVSTVYWE
jgi:hypothetical protein